MVKSYFQKCYFILFVVCALFINHSATAQVTYGAAGTYGLRLINPTYTGNTINVRRGCDNATMDIGFSCGALNTTQLTKFAVISNPLTSVSTTSSMAFSLRKMNCTYVGNAVNVRRSCDNTAQDIGFTSTGDFDTTALKHFALFSGTLNSLSTSAAAAYGLRKLNCSYAGKAINVRSSAVGSPTIDIGFTTNGDLDTASLKTFIGSNNGFIATWYDQSGNGKDASQGTTANQPRIVNAGVIDRKNGMPAIRFIGTSNMYLLVPQTSVFTLSDSYTIGSADVATAASNWWGAYRTGSNKGGASRSLANGESPTVSGFSIWSDWSGYAVDSVFVNQVNSNFTPASRSNLTSATLSQVTTRQTATVAAATYASTGITFGGDAQSTYGALTGYLSEIVFFSSALSSIDRKYIEWSQAQYYGISGLSLSSYPAGTPGAYITKWYDQSGNGIDASQGTPTNQPRIMNAGVIDRQNGLPAVFFNNTGAGGYAIGLQTSNINIFASAACFLGVASVKTDLTYNSMIAKTGANGPSPAADNYPCPFDFYYNTGAGNTQMLVGNGNNTAYNTFTASKNFNAAAGLSIWTYQANGTNASGVNAFYNGNTQIITNQTATVFGDQNTPLTIGARYDGVTGLNGWISEVFIFNAIPVTADISYLEYTQGQYYGISGTTYVAPSSSINLNAYITKWYDQSGNGKDLVQATNANQPMIVNAGAINLQGSLPAAVLDGSSYYMSQSAMSITSPYSLNAIATRTGAAGGSSGGLQRLINISATNDGYGFLGAYTSGGTTNYTTFDGNGAWNDVNANSPATSVALNTQYILSGVYATTGLTPYINGTAQTAKSGSSVAATGFLMGSPYSGTNLVQLWAGNISEFNIFNLSLSTTRRALLETNQAAYYGSTISNSVYTPAGGYNLFVTGIGRTSISDSVADSRQSGGMGFIVGTTATDFLKDNGDYITAGMTCPTAAVTTSLYMPAGATSGYERWLNDWYINKTDVGSNGGNLKIFFDFSDYGVSGVPSNASNYQLWGRATTTSNFTLVTTAAVTISGDRVVFTLPTANLGTNGYYTIGTTDYQNSPLPIELLYFTATPFNNTVDLNWATETETNNNYFTIEKSKDGVNFDFLKTVNSEAPNGNSTVKLNYKTYDLNPYDGVNYYRLKQTDYNGNYKYTQVAEVNFSKKSFVSVFPNPTTNIIYVTVSSDYDNATLKLMDALGREVLSQNLNSSNINSVNTSVLNQGIYYTIIDNGNGLINKTKIIIQK